MDDKRGLHVAQCISSPAIIYLAVMSMVIVHIKQGIKNDDRRPFNENRDVFFNSNCPKYSLWFLIHMLNVCRAGLLI